MSLVPPLTTIRLDSRLNASAESREHRFLCRTGSEAPGAGDQRSQRVDVTSLMDRVRDGDEAAFEQIVELFWARTLAYVKQLCGDSDRAYDVTQETYVRLWEKRQSWTGTGSVRVWLLRTARNLVIGDQRRWQVRVKRTLEIARELRPIRTPLEHAEAGDLHTAVRSALQELSSRRREAVTLFHLQGLSYREVSAIMGVRPQTAMNYVQAALADLRRLLAPHCPTPLDDTVNAVPDPPRRGQE